jgi:hypothetical protein
MSLEVENRKVFETHLQKSRRNMFCAHLKGTFEAICSSNELRNGIRNVIASLFLRRNGQEAESYIQTTFWKMMLNIIIRELDEM